MQRLWIGALAVLLFCGGPASHSQNRSPRILVLALDGVPWHLAESLRQDGHFLDFPNMGQMIAPFPSLSNYSWTQIWGIPATEGYQAQYVHRETRRVEGSSHDEVRAPAHPEAYDVLSRSWWRHIKAYWKGLSGLEKELRDTALQALGTPEPRVLYSYITSLDAIAHTEGESEMRAGLRYLDVWIRWVRQRHLETMGEPLEIVLVSDHGSRLVPGPHVVDVKESVESLGFRFVKKLKKQNEVASAHLGILSSVGFWTLEGTRDALAQKLRDQEWVDLVTTQDPTGRISVLGRNGALHYRAYADRFQIENIEGEDPLGLTTLGGLPVGSPLFSDEVLQASFATPYPDSLNRIRTGLTTGIRNPATILVSTRAGYEVSANGMGLATALTGRAGTHGGLTRTDTLGILTSTLGPVPAFVRAEDVARTMGLNHLQNRHFPVTLFYDVGNKKQLLRVSDRLRSLPGAERLVLEFAPLDRNKATYEGSFRKVTVDLTSAPLQGPWDIEVPLDLETKDPHRIRGHVSSAKGKRLASLRPEFLFFRDHPSFVALELWEIHGKARDQLLAQGKFVPFWAFPDQLEKRVLKGYPSVSPFKKEAKYVHSDSSGTHAESPQHEVHHFGSYDF